jgi:hypothetical protein
MTKCIDCGLETTELSNYDRDGKLRCARCTVEYSLVRPMTTKDGRTYKLNDCGEKEFYLPFDNDLHNGSGNECL